jgi:hypothetical protein
MRSSGPGPVFYVLVVLAVLSTTGCSAGPAPGNNPSTPADRAAAENDIAEAVFRYQFDHNASALQKGAEKHCLSLPREKMPSAEFLKRFESDRPPVVAADRCERRSGKSLFFRVQRFDWRGDNEVWVRGGYWEGNLSSSTEMYRVQKENGKWVVKAARMEAIS